MSELHARVQQPIDRLVESRTSGLSPNKLVLHRSPFAGTIRRDCRERLA